MRTIRLHSESSSSLQCGGNMQLYQRWCAVTAAISCFVMLAISHSGDKMTEFELLSFTGS